MLKSWVLAIGIGTKVRFSVHDKTYTSSWEKEDGDKFGKLTQSPSDSPR